MVLRRIVVFALTLVAVAGGASAQVQDDRKQEEKRQSELRLRYLCLECKFSAAQSDTDCIARSAAIPPGSIRRKEKSEAACAKARDHWQRKCRNIASPSWRCVD